MIKRISLSVLLALLAALPVCAAVEPQLAGDWQSVEDQSILHLDADGKYTKSAGGKVETGTIAASDGKWNLKSDFGRLDSGTFSLLGGELTMRSSFTTTTHWRRGSTRSGSSSNIGALPGSSGIKGNTTPTTYKPSSLASNLSLPTSQSQSFQNKPLSSSVSSNNSLPRTNPMASSSDPFDPRKAEAESRNATLGQYARQIGRNLRRGGGNESQPMGEPDRFLSNNSAPRSFTAGGGGGGHGTFSEMRKAFEQEQLNSLPPPKPIINNRQGDETSIYGVGSFESRAFGPAKAIRIKML